MKGGRKFSIIKHWKRQRSWSLGVVLAGDKELGLISGCDGLWLGLVAGFLCGMCLSRPWRSWEY